MPDTHFNKYRAAVEVLQRGRDVLMEAMADEVLENSENLIEGGFAFNEFLEGQGTRLHFLCLLVSHLDQSAEMMDELNAPPRSPRRSPRPRSGVPGPRKSPSKPPPRTHRTTFERSVRLEIGPVVSTRAARSIGLPGDPSPPVLQWLRLVRNPAGSCQDRAHFWTLPHAPSRPTPDLIAHRSCDVRRMRAGGLGPGIGEGARGFVGAGKRPTVRWIAAPNAQRRRGRGDGSSRELDADGEP